MHVLIAEDAAATRFMYIPGVVHPEPSVVPLQGSPGGRIRGDVWLVDPDLSHVEAVVGLTLPCVSAGCRHTVSLVM